MQLVEQLEAVPCSQMIGRHLGCRTGICFWRETYHNRRAADWETLWVSLSLAVISKRLIPGFYQGWPLAGALGTSHNLVARTAITTCVDCVPSRPCLTRPCLSRSKVKCMGVLASAVDEIDESTTQRQGAVHSLQNLCLSRPYPVDNYIVGIVGSCRRRLVNHVTSLKTIGLFKSFTP